MKMAPALLVLLLASQPAFAHKLKLFAQAEGETIVGTAYFAGGAKAQGSTGEILAPDGSLVAHFTTAEDGTFRVAVTMRQDYTLRVDSGDGHVAETVVRADEFPTALPAGTGVIAPPAPTQQGTMPPNATMSVPAELDAAIARQIRPLREQIDRLEDRTRFSDIMGGIGTIFGIFGVFAWIAARRKTRP